MTDRLNLRVGEWVEVRSKAEILQTLDQHAELNGLPFMPQMFKFCGQRFQVYKRAHKTCDTVFPVRGRRMTNAVHLETRCDGEAYGGCQAGCLLFWNEAWLKRVDHGQSSSATPPVRQATSDCTVEVVWAATRKGTALGEEVTYKCQATQLPYFTSDLAWWDVRQYIEDYTSGNVSLWRLIQGLTYAAYYNLSMAGIGLGPTMRWIYDRCYPLWRGYPFPRRTGQIPVGQRTPSCSLNLQPGEMVRVKSHKEILATLDMTSKNRGLLYDAEAVPFSENTYRVHTRVNKLLDEKTGKLLTLKNESVILDGVFCQSRYSYCRMFCPRSIHTYWREIWLERVPEAQAVPPAGRASELALASGTKARGSAAQQ